MNDTILSNLLVITSTSNADSLYDTCVKIRKTAEKEIRNALVKKTKIMFATLGFAHSHSFKNTDFDICCVDEACQASEPETLPLLKDSLKRLVLIGDPNQLPAVINSKLSEQAGYGVSLFERLYKRNYPYVMLSTQYRMHPKISEFCSKNFYGGQLKDGPNVLSESYTKHWHSQRMFGPLVFFNQEMALEEKCSTGSYVNSGEIDAIFSTLKDFFVKYPNSNATIGIVCLYKEQKKMMLEKMNDFSRTLREIAEDPKLVASFLNNIDVNTVDGFQGQQRDIILLSLVRANKKGSLGFITDIKRVNVSLTRAKHSLWIFGNKDVVCINPTWKSVIDYIQSNGAVIPCNSKSLIFTNYTVADIQNKTELEEQCE
ncbi:hypothetical protein ROZALSC1DRAFT_13565 [Rozella allomycis CSF55]|uniref:Uncharacterized protein n=1 Tax=Rozella allomycis (strain CSF55) TaxID=988480 RepID=A0A4P9YK20_ROZAC|nr:hypothetical protein ROZALSC1DRAFT_13565 [Rozella allomycis CSF55]